MFSKDLVTIMTKPVLSLHFPNISLMAVTLHGALLSPLISQVAVRDLKIMLVGGSENGELL